jgi:hypothetical protein
VERLVTADVDASQKNDKCHDKGNHLTISGIGGTVCRASVLRNE